MYVDLFIAETMASSEEAISACRAATATSKPVWVGFTVSDDDGGALRSGEELGAAARAAINAGAEAVLINCSAPEAVSVGLEKLGDLGVPTGGYANGFVSVDALTPGGTVDVLSARHDLGPEQYAAFVAQWIERGASIVGGCCEVGPAHIAELSQRIKAANAPHLDPTPGNRNAQVVP